jgi:hypothetical protein
VLTVFGFVEATARSLQNPGVKVNAAFIVNHIMDLDRIAANLTILDIRLASYRCVQHH